MDDKISLISIQSDRVKTSDQFDYMVDMEVKKMLEVFRLIIKGIIQ